MIAGCGNYEGVAPRLGGLLACTANGANTVRVATGGAMVDGKWYYNDANLDVNIPSAVGAGNTRIDRIVLRANWAGYEVAVTRIAGTDAGSPTAPSITQTSGTTYDIYLCQVLVNTAGAVTVTDERVRALPYYHREGGSATDWGSVGTTDYTYLTNVTMQMGSIGSGGGTVTFPVAFSAPPLVFTTVYSALGAVGFYAKVTAVSATQATVIVYEGENGGIAGQGTVYWLAIGPE